MPAHMPPPSKLPRLDAPSKGLVWRTWHTMKSKEGRRRAFSLTMNHSNLDDEERLARMRTLVDIGLWGDYQGSTGKKALNEQLRYMGYDVMRAMRAGVCSQEVLHLALEAGVDPNWRENNHFDDSLLTLFARHNQGDCLKLVLQAGADPTLRDTCGKTALHILIEGAATHPDAKENLLPLAEHLLEHGVDPNHQGEARGQEKSAPPIRDAIEKWDTDLVKWLLERGASLDVQDDYQESPLHWLASSRRGWNAQPIEPLVELLKSRGAPLDKPNGRGETPLWHALKWGNEEVAAWLIEQGVQVNCTPHTFRDHQGYEFPNKPGEPMLQAFCETMHPNEVTVVMLEKLAQDAGAWEATTPGGVPLRDWLLEEESPWIAFAQAGELEQSLKTVEQVPAISRRPRL